MRMYRFYNYPEERQSVTILNSKMSTNPNASRASTNMKHSRSNTWDNTSSTNKVLKMRSERSKTSELARQQTKSKTVTVMSSTNSVQQDESELDASMKEKQRGNNQKESAADENETLAILTNPSVDAEFGDSDVEHDGVITPHGAKPVEVALSNATLDVVPEN